MGDKTSPKCALQGADVIRRVVETLPNKPGVYRMLDEKGDVLYVGKAKDLSKRVRAYTKPDKQSVRIMRMISQTRSMQTEVTHTEVEALLLEASLIKKLKPRYNILLRDDKSFPYIELTLSHDYPRLVKHRGVKDKKNEYFGPFASVGPLDRSLNFLQRAFKLRNCTDTMFASRTRPCLQYQIKRCSAPCVGLADAAHYARQVSDLRNFLSGKSRAIQQDLADKMQAASDDMDFEAAAEYRDRIRALTAIQASQGIHIEGMGDADIMALAQEGGRIGIHVVFYRGGQNTGGRSYFPQHRLGEEPELVISAFIAQFYQNKPVPALVLTSHKPDGIDLLAEALSLQAGIKVSLSVPARGARRQVMQRALENAQIALARRLASKEKQEKLCHDLAARLDLDKPLNRIEIYDNSHISGNQTIGAMVVARPDGFDKSAYRKFNKQGNFAPGDDYAMMRETLMRRLTSKNIEEKPDLILIDGGLGQLRMVQQVIDELGETNITLLAIAKGEDRNAGRETFFMPGKPSFTLKPDDPLLYFLQNLRDEAHRYAITSHRIRRKKETLTNPLDEVPGVGPKRKKALLTHFGSAKEVARAAMADLSSVDGIDDSLAQVIYNHFHGE